MTPLYSQPLRGGYLAHPAKPAGPAITRRPAFYLTVIFVFVVYARFPEIMDMVTGYALHSARIVMGLALLATLLFGGELRAVFSKIGIGLFAFTLWLCVCVPFSVWRGGSVRMLRDFWALSLFSYVIVASSVQGLEQCRKIMYTLAAATVFIEVFTLVIGRAQGGRIALGFGRGILGNANYLALMLLMGLPFCLFVVRTKPGLPPLKFACLLMLFCIPVTIAATGSRGALVTLAIMFLLYFMPLPPSQKVVVGIVALILSVVAVVWSASALDRFKTIFAASTPVHLSESERSAVESMDIRKSLLLSSLQLTMRHPLLGVGPGMFAVANADFIEETTGRPDWNAWHETHNTFTQLSCEAGLPGLFLYCVTLLFCFKSLLSVEKRARQDPALSSIRHIAFALRLALIAFTGTAVFASNGYAYYFPMLAGLCVAVERASAAQCASQMTAGSELPVTAPQPGWAPAHFQPGKPGGSRATAWRPPAR